MRRLNNILVLLLSVISENIISQNITANFSASGACFNNSSYFTDLSTSTNGPIITWKWDFGDGVQSSVQNTTHVYNSTGTYSVTLIVTNSNGDKDTIVKNVSSNPLPSALFSQASVCLGDTTCFTNLSTISTGSIVGWAWNFGDPWSGANNISNLQSPCHLFTSAGTFTVIQTVTSDSGCQNTIVNNAIVYSPPVANFGSPDSGCSPICPNLTDLSYSTDGTIVSWGWNLPGVVPPTSTVQHPGTICYNTPGSYGASLTVTSNYGCVDSITIMPIATVYPWPTANFSYLVSGNTLTITDLSYPNIMQWTWDFGDGTYSTLQTPVHTYAFGGPYQVCLLVYDQHGCWDTICQNIIIAGVEEINLFNSVTIFPSASSSGLFSVSVLDPGVKISALEVYDVTGKKIVLSDYASIHSSMIPIDLSDREDGIYFVKFSTDAGSITKKIVIAK